MDTEERDEQGLSKEAQSVTTVHKDPLGRLIGALLRWWWLIVLVALVAGGSAYVFSLLMQEYEATAGVVAFSAQPELSLGSGFLTTTEDDAVSSRPATSDRTRPQMSSLAALVKDADIARQVADELQDLLSEEERELERLGNAVEGRVLEGSRVLERGQRAESDIIQIAVTHEDPEKAAAIANAWGRAFENHVNTIYGETSSAPFRDIQLSVESAREAYDQTQAALVLFLTEQDRASELERQVAEEERIIQLQRAAQIRVHERKTHLEILLPEAMLMLEQLRLGDASAARSSGLSLLAFNARLFSVAEGLPFNELDLEVPSIEALSPDLSSTVQQAHLEALVEAIEAELSTLDTQVEAQGSDLESQEISRREGVVRELMAERARLTQTSADLTQDRDLAWQAYASLLAKQQEIEVAAASEDSEVRFAAAALPSPTVSPTMNTAAALAAGALCGAVLAIVFDYMGLESDPRIWLRRRQAVAS